VDSTETASAGTAMKVSGKLNNKRGKKKPEWQTVSHKRKKISRQKSAETAEQINTANRYESLSRTHCDDDKTGNVSETDIANKKKIYTKPPAIYIYCATDYKAMVGSLAKVVEEETYFTKTLSNNRVRISTLSSETYGKLIRHIQDKKIIHLTYQIKEDRAYRDVVRDLHHSVSTNEIKNLLNEDTL
jgi:hypothetical protein